MPEPVVDQRQALNEQLKYHYRRADIGAKAWSTAYHGSAGLSAVLSIAAGILVQSQFENKDVPVTVLSFIAAALTALMGVGHFQRKWKINRLTRGKLKMLELDIMNTKDDLTPCFEKLKGIIKEHDEGIIPPDI